MDNISQQRQVEELQEAAEEDAQNIQSDCYLPNYRQISTAMESKAKDTTIRTTFDQACKIPKWAEAIDREYKELVDRQTWKGVKPIDDMHPIPFVSDFRIKDTVGYIVSEICKSRCCLNGDQQMEHRAFAPYKMYALILKHSTIRLFIV